MSPELVSSFRCKVVGAVMGVLWFGLFCLFFYFDLSPVPLDSRAGHIALASTFVGAVVGFPLLAKEHYRSVRTASHLCAGGVMAAAPLLLAVGLHYMFNASWPMAD